MKFNIELINGQILKEVYIATSKELGESTVKTKDDFYKALYKERLYYTGRYIQGTISSTKTIKRYDILDKDDEDYLMILNFVKENAGLFEDCDMKISDFILNNKNGILELLKDATKL